MPLPASGARAVKSRFGRHAANGRDAVAPLPEARDDAERRHKQLGWHAVPTLPETSTRFSTAYSELCTLYSELCTPRGFAAPLP